MTVLQAIIMAIVEGITEFLPISSTGHMVLTGAVLGIEKNDFTKLFIETVQFGAILSVLVLYWRKFLNFRKPDFYLKLLVAFIPAAIVGVLLKKRIEEVLESPLFITVVMFLGGIILLFVDSWFHLQKFARYRSFPAACDCVSRVQPQRCNHYRRYAAETQPYRSC
jgi:undecaprenyl-diphosphatase